MTSVAIVYHSATGRTRSLAEAVARGAISVAGTEVHLISVDEVATNWALLASVDAIVLGCPTYMGSASATFKGFMDSTAAVWALQGWRDKLAAGFTHSAAPSGDKLGTLSQLAVFAAQHGMIWVGLGLPPTYAEVNAGDDTNRLGSHLGAMAQSRPGTVVPEGDLRTADHLGRRVAEAAHRWRSALPEPPAGHRHPTTEGWVFPPPDRPALGKGLDRINLREIAARADRFEHHLVVCASIGSAQLEVTTASEPLYFGHVNVSDEYALTLPTGDAIVDKFPLRTFLSDPTSGTDVGRYNHRNGDIVLHPVGWMHWPGRLRAPYEMFAIPPGMRRCGLSLVYCANVPTRSSGITIPLASDRSDDVKAYVPNGVPMMLSALRGASGVIGSIRATTLELVENPPSIAPRRGGWVVVLETQAGVDHLAGDLIRVAPGASFLATGIKRALVFSSQYSVPDDVPLSWRESSRPPFAPFEDRARGSLPLEVSELVINERSETLVTVSLRGVTVDVPRYWLARTLFRLGLHGLRLGYVEVYGGMFFDDHAGTSNGVHLGLRRDNQRETIVVARAQALALVERIYRAVAPSSYVERLV